MKKLTYIGEKYETEIGYTLEKYSQYECYEIFITGLLDYYMIKTKNTKSIYYEIIERNKFITNDEFKLLKINNILK